MNKKLATLVCSTLFLTSCADLNSALDSVNKTISSVAQPPQAKVLNSNQICEDFLDNEVVAKRNWINSYVSVKGKIESIYEDEWGDTNVIISAGRGVSIGASLNPGVNIDSLKRGNNINIKGYLETIMHTGTCKILIDKATL
ncbi:OB-fold protein [Otariodibacter oris]|uniref:Putative nucleic acid binding protein n=1 Tax=Otariodibacter oris TaxID=1032623 RepID=A0A420XF69_9PAST|nr:hypothetical protein [Otariodibacter oris]QGM81546.1 hypothetical protein A6A10_09110 [Otariodibacter oris]RKR71156.1 putative nucleic acid binding protein [Otariodibacter oris]